jgi:hypothetical protein
LIDTFCFAQHNTHHNHPFIIDFDVSFADFQLFIYERGGFAGTHAIEQNKNFVQLRGEQYLNNAVFKASEPIPACPALLGSDFSNPA